MKKSVLLVVHVLSLLVVAWGRGREGCTFSVPSTVMDSAQCLSYDLSKIAALGGTIVNGSGVDGAKMMYDLNVCANLQQQGVPPVCADEIPAVSYQFDDGACHSIGDVNSSFIVGSEYIDLAVCCYC